MAPQGESMQTKAWRPPTLTRVEDVEGPKGGTNPALIEQNYGGGVQYFIS